LKSQTFARKDFEKASHVPVTLQDFRQSIKIHRSSIPTSND